MILATKTLLSAFLVSTMSSMAMAVANYYDCISCATNNDYWTQLGECKYFQPSGVYEHTVLDCINYAASSSNQQLLRFADGSFPSGASSTSWTHNYNIDGTQGGIGTYIEIYNTVNQGDMTAVV